MGIAGLLGSLGFLNILVYTVIDGEGCRVHNDIGARECWDDRRGGVISLEFVEEFPKNKTWAFI